MRLRFFLALLAVLTTCACAQAQHITVPAALAYDSSGNLFIADLARNQVVELTVGGDTVVIAGTGVQGFGGDGGPAAESLLNEPSGLAFGADGTLFIADTGNRRVRSVSNGRITTVVGNGTSGDSGDGSSATSAALGRPTALASDAGGILVCDTASNRVRRVADGVIRPFAGTGTQGFGGDGGPASGALLDAPQGLAVLADGRVLISDSHNNRIRMVATDGTISVFAGTGVDGFSGDGGPATAASLARPEALSVLPGGSVLVADSNNHRVRIVDNAGRISTVAGSGTQGVSKDAEKASGALMNVPRGVAVSPFGNIAIADASVPTLKAVAVNGNLYLLPAPASRTSDVAVAVSQNSVYGQTYATVSVSAVNAQGRIELSEGGVSLASGLLMNGASGLPLQTLSAANHQVVARYGGDGLNPAADSQPVAISIQPALVTASTAPAESVYGQALPPLSGTLAGILPQDAGRVTPVFSTAATATSDAGSYPVSVSLTGPSSSNYSLANAAAAGTLTIRQAKTATVFNSGTQVGYAGLPITLRATVSPEYGGDPLGEVDFAENGSIIARARTANNVANAVYLSPSAGTHVITATYLGNNNFISSSSSPTTVAVSALPDFSVQPSVTSQNVQAGLVASYTLTATSQGGPFTGSVTFSVSGLPSGATASFTPNAIVPGSTGATTVLAIQTPPRLATSGKLAEGWRWFAITPFLFFLKKSKRGKALLSSLIVMLLGVAIGCGDRTVGSTIPVNQSYALTVTATSTNLAGVVITHTVPVSLMVQ